MPDYRYTPTGDGFDDFDDFDNFDGENSAAEFDDFDDFDENDNYVTDDGFDDFDDFDNTSAENGFSRNLPPEMPKYPNFRYDDEPEFTIVKPPKEHRVRKAVLSLLSLALIIISAGISAHFADGFLPQDILTWRIGGATVGDLFKIGSAEQLTDNYSADSDKSAQAISEADVSVPDSVKYADFDIYEGNTYCTVKGYNGTALSISLPASYNGKPCTHIEANAFSNSPVKQIEIPYGYTFIGQTAFSGCSVTDLYLPDSITEIGWGMCSGNKWLKSLHLSSSLEEIPEWAFASCVSLTDLNIPGSIKTVGQWSFTDCTSLKKLTLNEGTVILDSCAFYGCSELSVAVLPQSVTTIGEMCFRSCTSLLIVSVPETLESIGKNAFMNCSSVLTLFGEVGGKWETYAKNNGLYFESIANLDLSEDDESDDSGDNLSDTDISQSDI